MKQFLWQKRCNQKSLLSKSQIRFHTFLFIQGKKVIYIFILISVHFQVVTKVIVKYIFGFNLF